LASQPSAQPSAQPSVQPSSKASSYPSMSLAPAPSSSQAPIPAPVNTYVAPPNGPCFCCAPMNTGTLLLHTAFDAATTTEPIDFLQCKVLCDGTLLLYVTNRRSTWVSKCSTFLV
jgi:hypothetical protein